MKKIGLIGVILLLSLGTSVFAAGGSAAGGEQQQVKELRFATGGVAGTYYPLGTAIGQAWKEQTGIDVTIQSTGASRANIQLIDAKEVEIALVQNDVADYAFRGVDLFAAEGKITSFSGMAALYPEVIQIVANPGAGIRTVADLRGKRVSVGDAGSGTEFNSLHILDAYGLTFNDIQRQNLGFGASAEALKDNRIDAFFCVAGPPTPAIVDLAITNNVVILEVDNAAATRLKAKYPVYATVSIPANSYNRQTAAVQSVSIKAVIVVANSVPENVIYNLTKTLFDRQAQIAAGHTRGNDINRAYAVEGLPFGFHPGAARYFKEVGAIR